MRGRFDAFGKKHVAAVLSRCGVATVESEVAPVDAQSADVYFVPAPNNEEARRAIGWFGVLAEAECLIELSHRTPDLQVARGHLRKLLTLEHGRLLEHAKRLAGAREGGGEAGDSCAGPRGKRRPALPPIQLWLVTTGCPRGLLRAFGMVPIEGWPRGFYRSPPGITFGIVVLRELPRTRETLLLRILGRGRTLKLALEDFARLPPDSPEALATGQALLAARRLVEETPDPDPSERAFLMATQEPFEVWWANVEARGVAIGEARGVAKGKVEGEVEGMVKALIVLYTDRFGPPPAWLRQALTPLVTDDTVGGWIRRIVSAASAEEVAAAVRRGDPGI